MFTRFSPFHLFCCLALSVLIGGCSDSSPAPQASGDSGVLTQGPVLNAFVWADNIEKGVRFTWDGEEEIHTTSDPVTGKFTLPSVPTYNYVLVSKGGTDKYTGLPGIQMMAPAGSDNISTLTTLVAMDTTGTVKAKLEAMLPPGVKFDADLSADGNTSPAALMVAKSVETIVTAMTNAVNDNSKVAGVSTISPEQVSAIQAQTMQKITEEFAKPAVTAATLAIPANLTTSLQSAATESVTSINSTADSNINIPAATVKTIATSSVTATTTALSIPSSGAATTAIAGGEVAVITPAVAAALVTETETITETAQVTIVATVTPPAYTPPPIQVVTPIYVPPPLGSQTIGNISFTPAALSINGTTVVSAVATSGLPVTFRSAAPSVCSVTGSTVAAITDGMCLVSANQAGNGSYSAAGQVQSYLTIRALQSIGSISLSPSTLNVGGTATATAASTSGLAISFNSSTPSVCSVSGSTVTAISAGTCTVSADQVGNSSYVSATQVTRDVTVQKNSQAISIITMPPPGVTAGASFTVAATAPGGSVSYSSGSSGICSNSGATFTMLTSGDCVVQYDQAGSGVYNAAPRLSNTTSVSLQSQTIDFILNQSALYMGDTATLTAIASSGLPVTFSTSSAACSVTGNTVTPVSAGPCDVVAVQAGNGRYSAAVPVTGSMTVGKKSQAIGVDTTAPASAIVGSAFKVAANASSGLPVAYSSGGVCSNSGDTFTMNSAGTCTVRYNQSGNAVYAAAGEVINNTVTNRVNQAIGVIGYTPKGGPSTTLSATASSGLAVVFSSVTPKVCSVTGATVAATSSSGTCTIEANQAGNGTYNAAATRTLNITLTVITTGATGTSGFF
jgi:hypothetical protein